MGMKYYFNLKQTDMKTIFYSLLALLLFTLFTSGCSNRENQNYTILIQSSDKNIPSVSLTQAAEIISKRLKDFSARKFDISVLQEKNQIRVILTDDWDYPAVENLIVRKGTIEFWETFNYNSLAELLNGDDHLFTLLTKSETTNENTKIGCTATSEVGRVTKYLNGLDLSQKCKFSWTQDFDKTSVCLYALKISGETGPVITGNDIESAKYEKDRIQIKLKTNAVGLFADATKRNLNNAIAMVLDDNVISAPKVMSPIESGEIEITGKFTQTQISYIASLLNNGVLPADFVIVK
jgi:preprotein translocase subunit SecD